MKTINKNFIKKDDVLDILTRTCRVKPKTLEKISKELNKITNKNNTNNSHNTNTTNTNSNNTTNNTNNTNNTINNTINNNINIVAFGEEDVINTLSKTDQMKILNKKRECLIGYVKFVYFNEKYPQLQNIMIKTLKDTAAYKFDTNKQDFIVTTKEELTGDVLKSGFNDIHDIYSDYQDLLKPSTKNSLKNYLDELETEIEENPNGKYIKNAKKNIQYEIYNNSDITKKKLKKQKLQLKSQQ